MLRFKDSFGQVTLYLLSSGGIIPEDAESGREVPMVIMVTPDLESALSDQARKRGIAPEALAVQTLRDRFLHPASHEQTQGDWENRLRSAATDCGVSLSDEAVSSEGLYE